MAKAATTDSVNAARREPQWRNAVNLIRGGIVDLKGKIDSIQGKVNEHWGTISSGFKVDKQGAKIFQALDQIEDDQKRVNTWRALISLVKHSDWPEMSADLIDLAEGEIIDPRLWGTEEAQKKIDEAKAAKKAAKPAGGAKTRDEAHKRGASSHLTVVPPPGEPKPSDDSDLAGEDDE